jgi:hypothetical protein
MAPQNGVSIFQVKGAEPKIFIIFADEVTGLFR